jgi:hypothetical protein
MILTDESRARSAIAQLCVLVSVLAVVPFFLMGQPFPGGSRWDLRMPDTHDIWLNFDQMRDFYQGLAAGELYPRWEEDTNYGFGAPTTCFYPPGFYYLTSLLYPLFHDWTWVLLAAHLLVMVAAAAAVYLLARRCMSRAASAVAMIAYALFPYHAIDQYQRGALAELLSFVCMPLILLFVDQLFSTGRRLLPMAGLALCYGAFLWSHPPTAYQFTLVLCPSLLLLAWLRSNWLDLLWTGGGLAFGAGLSAAYLYPAAVEQNFIRHEVIGQIWPYHATYLFMYAGYSKEYLEFFQLLNISWCFYVSAIVLTILALRFRLSNCVAFWTATGCMASFLMLQISAPIGRRIPKIDIGVFSWRMLAITTLVAALLAGACVQAALDARAERRKMRSAAPGVVATAVVLGGTIFTIFGVMAPMNNRPAFQPEATHTNYAIIPRSAPARASELPKIDRASLDGASGSIAIREWKPQHRVMDVTSPAAARLFVRTFNYPGWAARIDGRSATIGTDRQTGAMLVDLPAGEHLVTLDFVDTVARRLGAWITVASLVCLIAALVIGGVMAL